jgi:hypothetical protein
MKSQALQNLVKKSLVMRKQSQFMSNREQHYLPVQSNRSGKRSCLNHPCQAGVGNLRFHATECEYWPYGKLELISLFPNLKFSRILWYVAKNAG